MTDTITKPRVSAAAKTALVLAAAAVLLAVFALAAPGSRFFFPLVSLWCNLALFACVLLVLRVAGIKFDLFHKAVIVGLWAAALIYFFWALNRRSFIYIWDYVNYINKQYSAEAAFLQSPTAGFHYIFGSFAEDYTNFITLFLDFPFCLSDRTGDSFAFCQVFSILPMLLVLLAGLTIKVGQMLQVKNRFWYFLIGMSWMVTYPWLRMSAMLSQPDWFGLIFGFSILLLTLDFRFESLQPVRFCLLFAATAAIILSRRWYLYFVVGYYFAYAVLVLVSSARTARAGQKPQAHAQVRNLVLFGLMSMVAMLILLWPMVRKILGYDYAGRYSYYNFGGLTLELAAQALRIGLLNFILIGLGLWFAAKRRLPALPCLAGAELLISLLLFIRVQNSGSHQMLLFLPGWLLLFLTGAAALAEGISRHRAAKVVFWVFTLVFAVSVRCSPLTVVAMPGFLVDHFPLEVTREFVRLDKLIYDRKDLPQVKAIANWIDTHCAEGEISYMIPHDMLYCPDHFKNCQLPATPINNKLAFGFSVPGTHNFPMQFFEAKYVLTADPFPQTFVGKGEMSHKLNEMFLAVRDEYFTQEATFDMGNGTTFTIWRRTVAPTRAEVEYYLSAFTEEDAKYPEMFSEIAESWLAARGL
ncbi:hypothetical protein [Faecalibacterium sp.]|uniref:hypothetical protein n=1 Tax=Faecalibacterium sp. TaxID=1971605 RepID=UPI0039934A53